MDRPVPDVGDGLLGAQTEACIVADEQPEPLVQSLDGGLVVIRTP